MESSTEVTYNERVITTMSVKSEGHFRAHAHFLPCYLVSRVSVAVTALVMKRLHVSSYVTSENHKKIVQFYCLDGNEKDN